MGGGRDWQAQAKCRRLRVCWHEILSRPCPSQSRKIRRTGKVGCGPYGWDFRRWAGCSGFLRYTRKILRWREGNRSCGWSTLRRHGQRAYSGHTRKNAQVCVCGVDDGERPVRHALEREDRARGDELFRAHAAHAEDREEARVRGAARR